MRVHRGTLILHLSVWSAWLWVLSVLCVVIFVFILGLFLGGQQYDAANHRQAEVDEDQVAS